MVWLDVAVEAEGPHAVIHPYGEIDLTTTGILWDTLDRVIQQASVPKIEVDMSDVSFMDCAGIRALIPIKQHVREQGGTFVLTHVPHVVERLLSAVGLDHELEPCEKPGWEPIRSMPFRGDGLGWPWTPSRP
ncbi:STAS domain-containing protein [Microtetraspora sp. AC03309]|uniref:STAS domain-containing protein n=1 Tax=Microtetraspora sp. AC03309 TaxID=2779376 RepID=UPI001E2D0566|nr:STAS domain-containing protein [Microtetraspora sp. AC03309]MCC5578367.1 STAS domain-containing protein [Microtetraspora sp. AC03309]